MNKLPPRPVSGLPSPASPAKGIFEYGAAAGLLCALAGAAIGSAMGRVGMGAAIGAGAGVLGGVALGYYEGKNPTLTVTANGQYTVTLTAGQTLQISAPSGAFGSVGTSGTASSASWAVNGSAGSLVSGVNTVNVSWTDSTGAQQTATVQITAP